METHYQIETVILEERAGDELLPRLLDVQNSLEKSAALFSSRGTKTLGVSSSSGSVRLSVC